MLTEDEVLDNFEDNVDSLTISDDFKDAIIGSYQAVADHCGDIDITTFLQIFPSEEQMVLFQDAFDNDTIFELFVTTNMVAINAIMKDGVGLNKFMKLMYLLEYTMDFGDPDNHAASEVYFASCLFLLGVVEITSASSKSSENKTNSNVFLLNSKRNLDEYMEEVLERIREVLDDLCVFAENSFMEAADYYKNLPVENDSEMEATNDA